MQFLSMLQQYIWPALLLFEQSTTHQYRYLFNRYVHTPTPNIVINFASQLMFN